MNVRTRLIPVVMLAAASLTLVGVRALETSTYTIPWYNIDGGGVTFATGGAYRLGGTVGQPDVGVAAGGQYTLRGGFWQGLDEHRLFIPLVGRP